MSAALDQAHAHVGEILGSMASVASLEVSKAAKVAEEWEDFAKRSTECAKLAAEDLCHRQLLQYDAECSLQRAHKDHEEAINLAEEAQADVAKMLKEKTRLQVKEEPSETAEMRPSDPRKRKREDEPKDEFASPAAGSCSTIKSETWT
eukprot:gnl/TRDRNA2_/TRDRNA2_134925_c1_seq1.p1 gnl/TRDRNA2_/TRDRNA2_134925_c1~~gnl/TRDRNA2_/TRDRNA2_134925_c1_seq1.p1  ORF type:complete len:148 (-),score=36.25 gnl/TRDRNA2_/TRDRNA2_134925_c1_seq1:724-1167(-)